MTIGSQITLPPIPHASDVEKQIVGKLVADLLAAGMSLSVYDGEEFCLDHSTDADEIYKALSSTDLDWLHAYDYSQNPRRIARFLLVWGNGCDVISDHSDNSAATALVAGANALAEELSR